MTGAEDAEPRSHPGNGPAFKLAWYGLIVLGAAGPLVSVVWALAITDPESIRQVGSARRTLTFGVAAIPYSALLILAGFGVRAHKSWARWLGIALTGLGGVASIGSSIQAWTGGAMGSRFLYPAFTALIAGVFASLLCLDTDAASSSRSS